jgi:hypothetical protein
MAKGLRSNNKKALRTIRRCHMLLQLACADTMNHLLY